MKHHNQLRSGSLLTYVQMTLNIIVSIAYTPFMLRILGKSEYGLYSTVASTIAILSVLSLGFGGSYVRYYILYRKEKADDKIARLNGLFLIVFSVIGLIALACGLYLTFHLEMVFKTGLTDAEYHTARILMLLLTANLAVSFPMSVFSNIISAQEQFVFLKATEILRTVVSPLVTLPVLLAGYGSIGMVVITVTISVLVDVLRLIYCFGKLHIRVLFRGFDGAVLKDIAVFSGFIAINMVVDQVNNNLDKLIITRFCGTAATAVYAVGQQLHTYFISFSTAVSSVFTPRIHQLVQDNKDDKARLRSVLTELFVRVGRIQFLILSLVCTGIIFFGKPFIYFWAGPGYDDAYIIVLLLIIPAADAESRHRDAARAEPAQVPLDHLRRHGHRQPRHQHLAVPVSRRDRLRDRHGHCRRAGKRARDEHLLSAAAEHRRDRVLEEHRAHGARPAAARRVRRADDALCKPLQYSDAARRHHRLHGYLLCLRVAAEHERI